MGQSFEGQQSQAARDYDLEPNVVKKPRMSNNTQQAEEPEFEPDNGSEEEEEPEPADADGAPTG